MTEKKNKILILLLPVIIGCAIGFGLVLGYNLTEDEIISPEIKSDADKISAVLQLVESKYVDSLDRNDVVDQSIAEILTQLDPHSSYIPAKNLEEASEELKGRFGGVGIMFLIHDDTLVVTRVMPNSPSERAGMQNGDRIIGVDDDMIAERTISNQEVMELLKGTPGTSVELTVKRKNEIKKVSITRGSIPIKSIDCAMMLENNVGYIRLTRFAATTFDEFIQAIQLLKAQGMSQLVFDMRSNSGGYLGQAVDISNQFLEGGKLIVYTEGNNSERQSYYSTESGSLKNTDVVVLINSSSASATEIVAGALQDNDRGTIMGRRSFGKGLVQEQFTLQDKSAVRLTIARYYTPTGRCIQRPYEHGTEQYYIDMMDRYESGELMHVDSSWFVDSLKFTTPGGKVVYGGGGIMPDKFVALDTVGNSGYFTRLRAAGAFNHFAFDFLDHRRGDYATLKDFNKSFVVTDALLKSFYKNAEKRNVVFNEKQARISNKLIRNFIKAEIGRHLFYDAGFYSTFYKMDNDILSGIEELKSMK